MQLVSANSTKANLYSVALVNGAPFPDGVLLKELRTIPVVANFLGCDEKTVLSPSSLGKELLKQIILLKVNEWLKL